MCLKQFNLYFNNFISGLSAENKVSYLVGDFNINLLNTESDPDTHDFYDSLTANLFIPHTRGGQLLWESGYRCAAPAYRSNDKDQPGL